MTNMAITYDVNTVRGDTWNGVTFTIESQYTSISSAVFRVKARSPDTTSLIELSSEGATPGIEIDGNTVRIKPVVIDCVAGQHSYSLRLTVTDETSTEFLKTWIQGRFYVDNGQLEEVGN